jgi:hypothetical protein
MSQPQEPGRDSGQHASPAIPEPRRPAPPARALGQRPDAPVPAEHLLRRHAARLLNPVGATRTTSRTPAATAYVGDTLLLPAGQDGADALALLKKLATGLRLEEQGCSLLCEKGHELAPGEHRTATAYRLVPAGPDAVAVDAWALLERARAENPAVAEKIHLDHLMFGPGIGGTAPYTSGHGTEGGGILATYGQVGSGGRQVVSWVGQAPRRNAIRDEDRPRVAILDTGCGEHPWLAEGVTRYRIGRQSEHDDPEKYADQESPLLGELDSHSGHGTFVAGIIRQMCPDADLMPIRVMASDGVVREWETLHVLQSLAGQMRRWVAGHGKATRVDVVVLSLGYYHETPTDPLYTSLLARVLHDLGSMGVVVVTASGNDATTRPFYPAALSPESDTVTGRDRKRVPVVAVGSLNPDGESVALFNNHGPWIREWRPSVSLVSTVPTTMRGALQPRVRLPDRLPGEAHHRATIDDDDFTGGFAVWSGTSFAAPVLAAEVAGALLELAGERSWDRSQWLERGWSAVERVTSIRRGGEGL